MENQLEDGKTEWKIIISVILLLRFFRQSISRRYWAKAKKERASIGMWKSWKALFRVVLGRLQIFVFLLWNIFFHGSLFFLRFLFTHLKSVAFSYRMTKWFSEEWNICGKGAETRRKAKEYYEIPMGTDDEKHAEIRWSIVSTLIKCYILCSRCEETIHNMRIINLNFHSHYHYIAMGEDAHTITRVIVRVG